MLYWFFYHPIHIFLIILNDNIPCDWLILSMPFSTFPKFIIALFLFATIVSCGKPAREGDQRIIKSECLSAIDERCYAEMTEYTVLKDVKKLEAMKNARKVFTLKANRKVKILKRKIDIALIEYKAGKNTRQVWVAVKHLQ
jgi:hypothetical protein